MEPRPRVPGLFCPNPFSHTMPETPHELPENGVLLVLPAFRESRRLPAFLPPLLRVLRESGLPVRVRVVDDGSPESDRVATAGLVRLLSDEFPALLPLVSLPCNLGKGGAVYAGWSDETTARWLGFCDADGSVGPDEVVRLIRILLESGFDADALVASRRAGCDPGVSRSFWRGVLSRAFSVWVRLVTGLPVRDSQCGCKFVLRETYRRVRPGLTETRFAFDVELLVRLMKSGASIREEPVAWHERSGGTLSVPRDGFRMLAAVLRFR